jgi:histidyl-tRNA synthetase
VWYKSAFAPLVEHAMKPRFSALRGTRDLLPDDLSAWRFLESIARDHLERYGFREIRTPVLEATELFARSVGESTDIVGKEMYTFRRGDESVCLRPENTASVARAFVEHSLHRGIAAGYPERLYYIGPMFRYERPQRGRQRQFHQIGAEIFGAEEPGADVETIEMLWGFLAALGVRDLELVVNSLGDPPDRVRFRAVLGAWLAERADAMCGDCRRRAIENPLRVFDCKVAEDVALLRDAPDLRDHLGEEARVHFDAVLAGLAEAGIPYRIDSRMVRGLDYYRRTVFEVVSGRLGAQSAVLGGGRYDGLVAALGGPDVPGFGFAVGMERLLSLLPEGVVPPDRIDVAVVALGPEGARAAAGVARALRRAGVSVLAPLRERPLGAQMKRADRSRARFALFVGRDEVAAGRFGLKDLSSGEQVEASLDDVVARLGGTP